MERKKVAFLGPNGTFTEAATRRFLAGQAVERVPCSTIPDVLDRVQAGEVDWAVVPIENSIEGSVNLTLDWLIHQVVLQIQGELTLPITQHLLAAEAWFFPEITKVISHPQAVAQSRLFLHRHLSHAEIEYATSTAEAVRKVVTHPGERWAAIGPEIAQAIYGGTFLARNIQSQDNNCTRFVLVGTEKNRMEPVEEAEGHKTTFLVTLPADYPGALHQVLAAFAWRKINLTRIESRPTKKALGSYYFLIDAEHHQEETLLLGAVAEIEALGCQVRSFGNYPVLGGAWQATELSGERRAER